MLLPDFKKAFDKVPPSTFVLYIYKLSNYGIYGETLEWIKIFLMNRTQKVIVIGYSSGSSAVKSGIQQGTILGPLMFLCYIYDLPSHVKSSVKLNADDELYRATDCAAHCEKRGI